MTKIWKPTPGLCYQDSYHLLLENKDFSDAVLCHGWPHLTKPSCGRPVGHMYAHAWLEREVEVAGGKGRIVMAYDHLHLDNPVPRDIFYMVGQIDSNYVRRYTPAEAMLAACRHSHYGPWHTGPKK